METFIVNQKFTRIVRIFFIICPIERIYDNETILHVKSRYEFLVKNQSKRLSHRVHKKKKTYP